MRVKLVRGYNGTSSSKGCVIPDHENGEVIITGVRFGYKVTVYNEAGWQRDLPNLQYSRTDHACSSFTHLGEKVKI